MEKVLAIIKLKNNRMFGTNAFFEGKIVLGQIKVGDKLKFMTKDLGGNVNDCVVRGMSVNHILVDEAKAGYLINIQLKPLDASAYILSNDLTMLKRKCFLEFEKETELGNLANKWITVIFPDEFNFSCSAYIKEQNSQVQIELLYLFYLYNGQKVELKFEDKTICAKIVTI